MVTVEQLYKDFGVLADAKDKAGEHVKEYENILSGVKGGSSEKRLASQFVARFFKYFPTLAEQSLDAQFDLCEDDDINIRKQAIKDLPSLCKDTPEHLPRIADVLTQLLQSDDSSELSLVQSSLATLLRTNPKGALGGLFSQILQGEDIVRERAINFMTNKLKTLPDDLWTKDVEEYLLVETKKVLQDVTGEEFVALMKILEGMKSMSTMLGRSQLVDIITEQADLDKDFDASDPDNADRLIQCGKQTIPLFSKNVHSDKFLAYICDKVLPVLTDITSVSEEQEGGDAEKEAAAPKEDMQLEVLKLFADMSTYFGVLEDLEERVSTIYDRLVDFMPLPPSEDNAENTNGTEHPKLMFSHVECLMYAFHKLATKCPGFLTDEANAERLKDFRLRLQYFAREMQIYIKQLRMSLQGKTGDDLKTEENRIKVIGLKTTSNINTLIKELFHNPPSFKAALNLSFKPSQKPTKSAEEDSLQKRPGITPITFEGEGAAKKPKQALSKSERKIYSPPSGKFSEKAFPGRGGRGGQRGSQRGGSGGGRGWGGRGRGGGGGAGGGGGGGGGGGYGRRW